MNLLLKRSQSPGVISLVPLRIGTGTVFRLNAELEIDEEESALMKRYNLMDMVLIDGSGSDTFARAFRSGLVLGVLTFVVLSIMATMVDYRSPFAIRMSFLQMLLIACMVMLVIMAHDIISEAICRRCRD